MLLAPLETSSDSLARLATRHSAGVFRYLRSLVRDGEVARDLVQETFLRLRENADQAGPGLVFTVARSCALDYLRRRKTHERVEVQLEDRTVPEAAARSSQRPDHQLQDAEFRRDLLHALSLLSEEQRSVFHLSEIEGLSYGGIARILNVSPGTIASRKHHAVRKLREQLRRRGHVV